MDKYSASLRKAVEEPILFDLSQKLEIAIQIATGLISLHSGDFKISLFDLSPDSVLIDY
jgi:hypothetical protein